MIGKAADEAEQPLSAPDLIWRNAGEPPHKYAEEPYGGLCATCGAPTETGVSTDRINNPTFSNHAEFFKFGTHVCRACAWLYGDPKRTHRNVLAVGDELWWPMISAESATEERPSWLDLFRRLPGYPPDAPLCGVLTTDPKPRNWPRMRLAAVAECGLYVHAPDYDVAEYRMPDVASVLGISMHVRTALLAGFSKISIYHGLTRDYQRFVKRYEEVKYTESALKHYRPAPEFVPALLITQITKEEKDAARARNTARPEPAREARGETRQDDHRLF